MKQKSLLVLTGVTVAAIATALLVSRGGSSSSAADAAQGPLFPGLKEHVNDVARVRVEKAGKSVTIERDGGAWKLADRGGYPAKFEEVKELVVRIADLEIQDKLTARKENHAKLAVEWPTTAEEGSEAGEAGLVTLEDADGKVLASLVVGKSEWRNSKPKVYVRKSDEDQVWLVAPRQSLDVNPDVKSWIDARFVEVPNDRVQRVTIEHADGEKVDIARSASDHTKFAVQNLPPGRKERYDGIANGPAQALSYVQVQDVRPAAEIDFTQEPVARTRYKTTDGLELVVETAKVEGNTWLKLAASYTPPPEPAADDAPETDAETDAETPAEPAEEKKDVAAEAAELNQRLGPWAFQVDSYKGDVIARRMNDLMAELPPPEDDLGSMAEEIGLSLDEELPPETAPETAPADDDGAADAPADSPAPEPQPEPK